MNASLFHIATRSLPIAVATLLATPSVRAQTCASPLPLVASDSRDTCLYADSLPAFGAIASPQRDVVYRIPASFAGGQLRLTNTGSTPDMMAFVLPGCSPVHDLIDFAVMQPGVPVTLTAPVSPPGDRFLVVTGDPAGPYGACGPFVLEATPAGLMPHRPRR